ncbi:hypothetical protein LHV13_08160 [Ferrovum sp. PN-J185]|uniref:hypothetical protein n=1 Tax=Ferrovum sp. PN-J185 TaxID=1356306 RepID=UPI001E59C705|nr:hypothetical protein [Ferrovum sp. PN-J185]MCC6069144.1 hypothetical protein [Ferrovum sp. PN-J185]MDE1890875.1 hypothetical protein [Betaproteobacteria bacterium]MDE2055813.1 hypothetical protein [Betaproteobacteria bacterium]
MKLVKYSMLIAAIVSLSACSIHQENDIASQLHSQSETRLKHRQEENLIGTTWLQINQDLKVSTITKQQMVNQWLSGTDTLNGIDRVRLIALLLLNVDTQSHIQALRLLTSMPDTQKTDLLPIVEWQTALAKNQIIQDSQMRDVTQQLSEAQLKITALQKKIKELKALESNLLSKPSENH